MSSSAATEAFPEGWLGPARSGPGAPAPTVLSTGATVRILVRLKLRLVGSRMRSGRRLVGVVLASVASLAFGITGMVALIALGRTGGTDARVVVVVGSTALVLGWMVLPLVLFGADETLDPAHLRAFPLRPRAVVTALGVAAVVGPAPLATVLVAVGAVIGFGGGAAVVVVVPAAVLLVACCVVLSRALLAVLAAALTSRKGRDLVAFLLPVLVIGVQGLRFFVPQVSERAWRRTADVVRWGPPGMLGQAMADARAGRLAQGAVELVPAAVLVLAGAVVWSRALDRALTQVEAHGAATPPPGAAPAPGRRRRRARPAAAPALPADGGAPGLVLPVGLLRRLRPVPWVAVASKELRVLVRHPKARGQLLNMVVLGLAPAVYLAVTQAVSGGFAVVLAASVGPAAVLGAQNQFGLDGSAFWTDLSIGNLRAVVVGKNVALGLVVLPVGVLAGVVLAVRSGQWTDAPAVAALAVASLGAGFAVANQVAVRYPMRVPESTNPFGGGVSSGQGCLYGFVSMAAVAGELVLMVPVVLAAVLADQAGPMVLLAAAGASIAYGYGVWRAGVAVAARYAADRQPEILAAIDRRAA